MPKDDRTKQIQLNKEPQDSPETPVDKHYELHINAANSPAIKANKTEKKQEKKEKKSSQLTVPKKVSTGTPFTIRIWNLLEWIAMSALIFLIIFFFINFASYSELLQLKISKLTGTFQVDPFIEEIADAGDTPVEQELLPLQRSTTDIKEQLPAIDISIAPPDDRVVIPRINKNVPVVGVSTENLIKRDWGALEKDIQQALRDGVVHYPGTSQPGERGNVVITGHSSYFPWDPGRFKDVFALLHDVVVGDEIVVYHDQESFKYKISEKKVVAPDQIDVLTQQGAEKLTLITCTPVGTNLKRLIIIAKPV